MEHPLQSMGQNLTKLYCSMILPFVNFFINRCNCILFEGLRIPTPPPFSQSTNSGGSQANRTETNDGEEDMAIVEDDDDEELSD